MKIQSHCFPDLKGGKIADNADKEDSCSLFKPLYGCVSSQDTANEVEYASGESEALFEQARRNGFQNGLTCGEKDGIREARENLVPALKDFIESYNHLQHQTTQLSETTSSHMIKLAKALVGKVLGPKQHPTINDLKPLLPQLHEALAGAFRLKINIAPSDLKALEELAGAGRLEWFDATNELKLKSDTEHAAKSDPTHALNGEVDPIVEKAVQGLTEILAVSKDTHF